MANLRLWMIAAVLACTILTRAAATQVDSNDVDDNARAGKPPVTIPTEKVGDPATSVPGGDSNHDDDEDDNAKPYVPKSAVNPPSKPSDAGGVPGDDDDDVNTDDDVEEVVINDQRLIILGH